MAYTFTEKTFTNDSTFDSLYADSLTDLESGTVRFTTETNTDDTKKQFLKELMCDQTYTSVKNIEIAKDGVVCMWVQGKFEDNTYTWVNALVGKLDNSKSWCSSTEFHQANKTWIQSIGGNKFQLEFIKGSAIDTFFTGIHNAGICLGTLSTQDFDSMGSIQMKVMTWVY